MFINTAAFSIAHYAQSRAQEERSAVKILHIFEQILPRYA